MADSLVLVETPEQLAHVPAGARIVSLSPMVEVALEQSGRPYTRPEDYFDERELEEEGVANFKKVEALCGLLDGGIQREAPFAAQHELQPASFNFYFLKIIYDAFFLRTYQLNRILSVEQPRSVICFERDRADLESEWFSEKESFYAPIVETISHRFGFETICLKTEKIPDPRTKHSYELLWRWSRIRSALSRRIDLFHLILSDFTRIPRKRLLCLDTGYNVPFIVHELIQESIQIWVWDNDRQPRKFGFPERMARALTRCPEIDAYRSAHKHGELCERVLSEPALRELCNFEGYDLWSVVRPRLERVIKVCLPDSMQYCAWAAQVFDRLQPDAVLASDFTHSRAKTIAHAARRRGIPVIGFHHGEVGTHHVPVLLYQDLNSVDAYLCYGDGTATYIRRHTNPVPSLAVVGAPMIEKITREAPSRRAIRQALKLDQNRPVVLYLLTNMDGNWRYISYRIPSDSTHFRIQKRIVSVLARHSSYRVVIKEHPGSAYQPLETWIAHQRWPQVKVLRGVPYSALIHLADVVIIDAPATAMFQALQTRNAIYVFNDWFRWEPEALEALKRCSVYSNNLDAFCERLDADLSSGRALEGRCRNDDYLHLFCRPHHDIPSALLAAKAIKSVLKDSIAEGDI